VAQLSAQPCIGWVVFFIERSRADAFAGPRHVNAPPPPSFGHLCVCEPLPSPPPSPRKHGQYCRSAGHPSLTAAIATLYSPRLGYPVDASTQVVVTCGATQVRKCVCVCGGGGGSAVWDCACACESVRVCGRVIPVAPVGVRCSCEVCRAMLDFPSALMGWGGRRVCVCVCLCMCV
jgi:hypothetical protein